MLELHSQSCFPDASSIKQYQLVRGKAPHVNMVKNWMKGEQFMLVPETRLIERLGRMQTKPRDSVALGVPHDERVNKRRSQLFGGYFQPVLFSNKMHWFHGDRILVGDFADPWVPELAPSYWDHEFNWWMVTQHLSLHHSGQLELIWNHKLHMVTTYYI
jgi:hypothetical protein